MMLKAAHNLVLHTSINKVSAFYRLLMGIRAPKRYVHPQTKRLTTMLYAYTRIFFERTKKDAFDILLLKTQGKSK